MRLHERIETRHGEWLVLTERLSLRKLEDFGLAAIHRRRRIGDAAIVDVRTDDKRGRKQDRRREPRPPNAICPLRAPAVCPWDSGRARRTFAVGCSRCVDDGAHTMPSICVSDRILKSYSGEFASANWHVVTQV